MDTDQELLRRGVIAVGILSLIFVVVYALFAFISVLVFAIFLYYAVRPIFRFLDRYNLGRRVRAALSIFLFGLPFLVLIAYSVAIVAFEIRTFLRERDLIEGATERLVGELNIAGLDLDSLGSLASGGSQASTDVVIESLLGAVSFAGSVLVQLMLIMIGAYYLLVDGPRLVAWFLDTYDESGIGDQYASAVDAELSVALFGNIVNVFVTAIVAIATFYVYNLTVVETVAIPFPALLGALAGVGSLIPIIGIKIVYVPLCIGLAANAWLAGEPQLLGPVVALSITSAIVVDFIPDFVIRAQVSSDETHTGLLLVGYIIGPSVFGFYGLFLAPIILVCLTNAVKILLPYIISGQGDSSQRTLDSFGDVTKPATDESTSGGEYPLEQVSGSPEED